MSANVVIDEAAPDTAYGVLATSEDAVLIDVRTRAEWDHYGIPDLSATGRSLWLIEWVTGPGRAPTPAFFEELMAQSGGTLPGRMMFICKSGGRSWSAAHAVGALAEHLGQDVHCTNVAEGFDGHPAAGPQSGWKARGLPCRENGYERGKE